MHPLEYASTYRGRPAIAVEGGGVRVLVLPEDGAKLVSISALGREWLAEQPPARASGQYRRLGYHDRYVDAECCGFDDMFPTCDPWTPGTGPFAGLTWHDHGETCRIAYDTVPVSGGVCLRAVSRRFPLTYSKTVTADNDGVRLTYHIENTADVPFPALWAGHCMLRGEDGARVITPFDESAPRIVMFGPDNADQLPHDRLIGYTPDTGAAYKFYYEAPVPEGQIGLRLADGRALTFHYDPTILPWLGIWLNNGRFQRLYTIALEPATLPYDSPGRAAEHSFHAEIPPHASLHFSILIRAEA